MNLLWRMNTMQINNIREFTTPTNLQPPRYGEIRSLAKFYCITYRSADLVRTLISALHLSDRLSLEIVDVQLFSVQLAQFVKQCLLKFLVSIFTRRLAPRP